MTNVVRSVYTGHQSVTLLRMVTLCSVDTDYIYADIQSWAGSGQCTVGRIQLRSALEF